uniref:Periviscerokinin-2 n=2 Tax=Termitoidae TaxID=1912919 RepID=PVK2_MASDA|nr:RecName: Full=Periviscerokinin-2; Short=MasDa-PVK-2 [Mastotermes darwiniensis]
GSSGLIPMPRV